MSTKKPRRIEKLLAKGIHLIGLDGAMCGGLLIARDVILTTAHCHGEYSAIDYAVVGKHDVEFHQIGNGEMFAVREVMPHPNFNYMLMSMLGLVDNHFMLMFLEGASTAKDVITVKLNSNPLLPIVGQNVTVMGWGDTYINDDFDEETQNNVMTSNVLMSADVTVISNEEHKASAGYMNGSPATYSGRITVNMLCATSNGKDSCQGDSSGPLVVKGIDNSADVQVGVVLWAIRCTINKFPSGYACIS
jgi:trypsin